MHVAPGAGQSPSTMQATQTFVKVSQAGVAPVHVAASKEVQATQWPAFAPMVSQAGVPPEQSAGTHARHVPIPASQIGVVPPHAASVVHPAMSTQLSSVSSPDFLHIALAAGHSGLCVHATH
jgi:hypothetical protein